MRPLGIPTVKDRVVQAAVLLILEPIFEADFRGLLARVPARERSAHDALEVIRENCGRAAVRCMTRTWKATSTASRTTS